MQSIYVALVSIAWMAQEKKTNRTTEQTNKLTNRKLPRSRGIVIILLLFYLNWSKWNDMHIHKSPLCIDGSKWNAVYSRYKYSSSLFSLLMHNPSVCSTLKQSTELNKSLRNCFVLCYDCLPNRMKNVWENNWNRNNNNYPSKVVSTIPLFFVFYFLFVVHVNCNIPVDLKSVDIGNDRHQYDC